MATDCVSFKAYLKRDGQADEVRRFGIEGGAATNFMYLRGKIAAMFPSLRNDNFQVSWKDQEGDVVTISSDEELVVALTENSQPLNRIYITVPGGSKPSSQTVHPNITCDGCQMKSIQGYRYKCLTCRDFDLCAKCEADGLHSEHFMLRVPVPTNLRPYFGHRFSRSPQRSHKGQREGKGHKHGKEFRFGGHCPMFTRHTCSTEAPDWDNLIKFISNVIPNENMLHNLSAETNTQTSSAAPNAQPTSEQNKDIHIRYLHSIGESIAAFLDPLGIDVYQKQKDSGVKQAAPATSASNEGAPMPSTSQDLPKESVQIPVTVTTHSNIQSPLASSVSHTVELQQAKTSRRPSLEGWTVLNRDTHSRSPSQPMDVDEGRGAIPKQTTSAAATNTSSVSSSSTVESVPAPAAASVDSRIYPNLSEPSAPLTPQDTLRQGIQEALEKMVSMGFDVDIGRLQSLLQSQNGDIAKVVDFLLK